MAYSTALPKPLSKAQRRHNWRFHGAKNPSIWLEAHPEFNPSHELTVGPRPFKKLLRVETAHFCAGAVYEKVNGVWCCIAAAPILSWLKRTDINKVKVALLRMEATWSWLTIPISAGKVNGAWTPSCGDSAYSFERSKNPEIHGELLATVEPAAEASDPRPRAITHAVLV